MDVKAIVTAFVIGGISQTSAQSDIGVVGKAERNALRECWNAAAQSYANETCEPSESVIVASFGKCMSIENKYRKALLAAHLSEGSAVTYINGYRAGGREYMASIVLDARSASGACLRNSN